VQNALQAIALQHGLRRGSSLWSQAGQHAIESLPFASNASQRRAALLALYAQLQEQIDALDRRVEELAGQRPQSQRLMTHPGVGPSLSRRQFTREVKLAALQRLEMGASVSEVARAFEVNPNVLHRWRREFRQGPGNIFPGLGKRR